MVTTQLNRNIQTFYDASSPLWEEVWGEHMHHGYYGPDGTATWPHVQAQIAMVEALLQWGKVAQVQHVLDLGCGVGGSSVYLARQLAAKATGITLSPVQARRARVRAAAAGLHHRTCFAVADALDPPFAPGSFDLVWSLENGEHIPDKRQYLQRCAEMLASGGTLLLATWCRRPLPPALSAWEQRFFHCLYRAYHVPPMISIPEYTRLATELGYADVMSADWTTAVAPFWPAVLRSALRLKSLKGLMQAGRPTVRGALAMPLMIWGYRCGLLRFGVLQGRAP